MLISVCHLNVCKCLNTANEIGNLACTIIWPLTSYEVSNNIHCPLGILHIHCIYIASLLQIFCKSIAIPLQVHCKSIASLLQIYCKSIANLLLSVTNFGKCAKFLQPLAI